MNRTTRLLTDAWRRLGTAMLILALMTPPPATGQTSRMVMVEGLSMHIVSAGLEARAPGQPVIILESGGGSPLETWNPILPAVAEFAPVLTYERSGVGSTPWDGGPRTPTRVVVRLRALLDELDVAPPYVLVGHSWGGPLIHRFAGTYPDQVVAMVYIDPTDFMMNTDVERAILESLDPGGGWVEWWDRRRIIGPPISRVIWPISMGTDWRTSSDFRITGFSSLLPTRRTGNSSRPARPFAISRRPTAGAKAPPVIWRM